MTITNEIFTINFVNIFKTKYLQTVDPEKQKIADDLRIALAKGEKTEFTLVNTLKYLNFLTRFYGVTKP